MRRSAPKVVENAAARAADALAESAERLAEVAPAVMERVAEAGHAGATKLADLAPVVGERLADAGKAGASAAQAAGMKHGRRAAKKARKQLVMAQVKGGRRADAAALVARARLADALEATAGSVRPPRRRRGLRFLVLAAIGAGVGIAVAFKTGLLGKKTTAGGGDAYPPHPSPLDEPTIPVRASSVTSPTPPAQPGEPSGTVEHAEAGADDAGALAASGNGHAGTAFSGAGGERPPSTEQPG